jgi:hypothetical protein
MPHTGLACPTCDATGITNPLMTGVGVYGYRCGAGHIFPDMETLLSLKPRTIGVPHAAKPPREGMTEFKTALPSKLVEALKSKFGDKLSGAIECILIAIMDPGSFLVSGFDVERLQQHLGQKVKDSGHLVGMIVNLKMERDEARKEAEANKTAVPAGAAPVQANEVQGDFVQVTLRIPIDQFMEIKEKARFNGQAPANYIAETISYAVENKWL